MGFGVHDRSPNLLGIRSRRDQSGLGSSEAATIPDGPLEATPLASAYSLAILRGYASLASCGFWIWGMKGFRWYATSLMALAERVTCSALFVAGMSVTGDWL